MPTRSALLPWFAYDFVATSCRAPSSAVTAFSRAIRTVLLTFCFLACASASAGQHSLRATPSELAKSTSVLGAEARLLSEVADPQSLNALSTKCSTRASKALNEELYFYRIDWPSIDVALEALPDDGWLTTPVEIAAMPFGPNATCQIYIKKVTPDPNGESVLLSGGCKGNRMNIVQVVVNQNRRTLTANWGAWKFVGSGQFGVSYQRSSAFDAVD